MWYVIFTCDMYNHHNKTLPDSCLSVSDKPKCAFITSHWTFHFKCVVKQEENVISF